MVQNQRLSYINLRKGEKNAKAKQSAARHDLGLRRLGHDLTPCAAEFFWQCAAMKLISITAPYFVAAGMVLIAASWGASRMLGAHPFWSSKIAWIGVPIGLLIALACRRLSWTKRLFAFSILLALSAGAAHFGRLRFAASFAEDRLAGNMWFFGWIGVAVFLTALIAAILTPKARIE